MKPSRADAMDSGLKPLWRKHLLPGDLFATTVPHVITTVLGSCVAVCLWDPVLMAGGMNHFMLARQEMPEKERSNRYGDTATLNLIHRMEALGSSRGSLMAKLYGGGSVIAPCNNVMSMIGRDNIEIAREVLRKYGIRVTGEHVGDFHGRRLEFNTRSGELTLSYISPLRPPGDSAAESNVLRINPMEILTNEG